MPTPALDQLLHAGHIWQGHSAARPGGTLTTGIAALDEQLPGGGWPLAALTEILLPASGVGEISLLWPTLARLTQTGQRVVLVAPPHLPYPCAWQDAGVALAWLSILQPRHQETLWAAEQCLRSGSCAAVLCWPASADDKALRRLQVAAGTGQSLGFVYRPKAVADNPSPAAVRLIMEPPGQVRILKCRGGTPAAQAIAWG